METIGSYLFDPVILQGLWTTVYLAAAVAVCSLIAGAIAAAAYVLGGRFVRVIYMLVIGTIRSVPLIVWLVFIYSALPTLGIVLSVTLSAILGLSLVQAAFMAEIMRGGIQGIADGQWDAGRSIGLSDSEILWRIIIPQGLRSVVPALGNMIIIIFHATSLASVISLEELFRSAQYKINEDYRVFLWFSVAALYYLALCGGWSMLQKLIERGIALPTVRNGGARRPSRLQLLTSSSRERTPAR